eukprot:m.44675 g.44675  ORF g.44675 m.44675 type:complete len:707 (-) comp13040_c0_seq1:88-2208(-)
MAGLDGVRSGTSKDFFLKMKAQAQGNASDAAESVASSTTASKAAPPPAAKPKKSPAPPPAAKPKPKAAVPPPAKKKPVAAPPPAAKPKPKVAPPVAAKVEEEAAPAPAMSQAGKSEPGAAAANNKAFFMQMKAKAAAPKPEVDEAAEKAKRDAEAAAQKAKEEEEEKAKLAAAEAEAEAARKAEEAAAAAAAAAEAEAEPEPETEPEPEPEPEQTAEPAAETAEPAKTEVKTHRCKAVMAYKAKNDSEISFAKDDIVFVLSPDLSSKTLKGVCQGTSGSFPGHTVENTEDGQRCGDPAMHFKMGVKCRALGNYEAKSAKELSFKQGDVLFIAVLNNNTMLQAVFNGQAGLVPRSFVVDVEAEPEVATVKPVEELKAVGVAKCIGIRSHYSNRAGWLDFDIGDSVMVPKKTGTKVWQGVFKGNVGKLRADFVVDTANFSEEQIAAMVAKAKAAKTPQASATASPAQRKPQSSSRPSPAAASAPKSDPFAAPAADPFASSGDPFASPSAPTGSSTPLSNPPASAPSSGSRRSGRGRPAPKQMLGALDASAFEAVSAAPAKAVTPLKVKSVLEAAPGSGGDPFGADTTPGEEADPFAALARDVEVPAPASTEAVADEERADALGEAFGDLDLEGLGNDLAEEEDDDDEDEDEGGADEVLGEESMEAFDDGAEDASAGESKDKKQLKAEAKRLKKEAKAKSKLERKASKK